MLLLAAGIQTSQWRPFHGADHVQQRLWSFHQVHSLQLPQSGTSSGPARPALPGQQEPHGCLDQPSSGSGATANVGQLH